MTARFHNWKRRGYLALMLGVLTIAALALEGGSAAAQSAKTKPATTKPTAPARPARPLSDQVIPGAPLNMTVEDLGRMQIRYRDYGDQFFGGDAEGVYLWADVGGTTTVFGPGQVPAGRDTNAYIPVSNLLTGSGTPSDPWVVTTVNLAPNTNLKLTQKTSYVNGAEFVALTFKLEQTGGSVPETVTMFHASDLFTAGVDSGYGYYDPTTGGVGDYFTPTMGSLAGTTLYQQFVPNTSYQAPAAYMESNYYTIWANIGDTSGPGAGFDNTIISDAEHDSGNGLQWNLTVPPSGSITVGDTDLFSPHGSFCGSFSDVPYGSYYYNYIYYLVCHGIVSGFGDTTFRPQLNVTRGQEAKIVANSAGFNETPTGQLFTDVAPGSTYYPYVQRMATRSLISGYPCGGAGEVCDSQNRAYFRPNGTASRGQIAKLVSNAAGLNDTPAGQTYADVSPSSPFYLYIERLTAKGTMGGYACGGTGEPCDGQHRAYFRYNNFATRGQTSKIDTLTFFPTCCSALRP